MMTNLAQTQAHIHRPIRRKGALSMVYSFHRHKIIMGIFMLLVVIFSSAPPSWGALNPIVTDVTTRSISVVWTKDAAVTSSMCALVVKDSTNTAINTNQIALESDAAALARGIVKFEVIGLEDDSTYSYEAKHNGSVFASGSVTTEKFRGLASFDPNINDIVANDILHVPVYNTDNVTPALGALVMAEIYQDAACTTTLLSDSPITGWVGVGMPGDVSTLNTTPNIYGSYYNPNNVCYKDFAAINMNNLFARANHYPLQLEGDIASTPKIIEGEYIKLRIIYGIENSTMRQEKLNIIPVPEIIKVGGQKVSSAKVAFTFRFPAGYTAFSYPCELPQGYETKQLFEAIEAAGGNLLKIHRWNGSGWDPTLKKRGVIEQSAPMSPTGGYIIQMNASMTQDLVISGFPKTESLNFNPNSYSFCSFPQVPDYYQTGDLFLSVENAGAEIVKVFRWNGAGWDPTLKKRGKIEQSVPMNRACAYMIQTVTNGAFNINPLEK